MKKRIPLHKLYSVIAAILIMVSITGCSERMPVFTYLSGETEASQSTSEQGSSPSSDPSQPANSSLESEYDTEIYTSDSETSGSPDQSSGPSSENSTGDTDSAQYGLLYDIPGGKIIWSEGADSRVYPASLTKLLTAYTALKYVPSDTVFTVGTELNLVQPNSSLCLISEGQRITLYDLICGMLMASGNDAAYTVAVNTSRLVFDRDMTDTEAVQAFCELMNQTAEELGMNHSHFCNPDGWDNPDHYTTVNDLLLLSMAAYANYDIRNIAYLPQKHVVFESGQNITWKNTNWLLNSESEYYYPYATGLKTGTTANAGNCLIATARKDGQAFIVIGMGFDTNEQRFDFAIKTFDKAFNIESE